MTSKKNKFVRPLTSHDGNRQIIEFDHNGEIIYLSGWQTNNGYFFTERDPNYDPYHGNFLKKVDSNYDPLNKLKCFLKFSHPNHFSLFLVVFDSLNMLQQIKELTKNEVSLYNKNRDLPLDENGNLVIFNESTTMIVYPFSNYESIPIIESLWKVPVILCIHKDLYKELYQNNNFNLISFLEKRSDFLEV